MYSTEFDSGCLVCFIEIISLAEPQWEIPLYVWQTILALSSSWSCFQSCTPQVRPRSAIFHSYKSETKSIPVFFLGSSPPSPSASPSSQTLSTSASQEVKCFSEEQELSELPTDGNRPMTLIRITGKGSLDSCFYHKTEQNLFIIHRAPDSTYGEKIIGIAKTVLFQSSNYSLRSRRWFLGLRQKFRGSTRNQRLARNGRQLY